MTLKGNLGGVKQCGDCEICVSQPSVFLVIIVIDHMAKQFKLTAFEILIN